MLSKTRTFLLAANLAAAPAVCACAIGDNPSEAVSPYTGVSAAMTGIGRSVTPRQILESGASAIPAPIDLPVAEMANRSGTSSAPTTSPRLDERVTSCGCD
jgi:hypothetical protein